MGAFKYTIVAAVTILALAGACARDEGAGPVIDTVPPLAPVGIEVSSQGDDLVQVFWSPNADADLAGYTVYRSSTPEGPFGPISTRTLECPWFFTRVTVMEITYFRVTALDQTGNESAYSQVVGIYLNKGWRNPPMEPADQH